MTPKDLRELAAQLDAAAVEEAKAGHINTAVLKSMDANKLRETAREQERRERGEGLPEVGKSRTVRTVDGVDTTGKPGIVKRAASRSRRKHPAQAALYNAGLTIQDLADALGEKRARVSHWMGTGSVQRPIPRVHADALDKGIPVGRSDGALVKLRIPRTVWGRIGD